MEAGELTSGIHLVPLDDTTLLVYDQNWIVTEMFEYLCIIKNDFPYVTSLFPEEIPLRHITQFLTTIQGIL